MVKREWSPKPPYKLHPAGRKRSNIFSASHQGISILTRKLLNAGKGSRIKESLVPNTHSVQAFPVHSQQDIFKLSLA